MAKATPSKLIKKLTKVFNYYIRCRDTDWMGYGSCISCKRTFAFEQLQAGHYWTTKDSSIRYYEKNVHAQCVGCNTFREGNKPAYTLSLIRKYGPEILDELDKLRQEVTPWRVSWLREKIAYYEEKIKEIDT